MKESPVDTLGPHPDSVVTSKLVPLLLSENRKLQRYEPALVFPRPCSSPNTSGRAILTKAPDPRSDKPQISSAVRVTSRHGNLLFPMSLGVL
ncbi:hypothetical protein AVEN_132057-1 [Araneus ventricosus]|uniref:Uncharacterized protein n=1 Tax=Araneus ventricosus TaxID=182803 RepID=A0A4Y2W9D0_ARAVE|nr:hypothetical protein AVEN_132057-1 [Araneus ventricosus]